jgi:hypothetical protein
LRIGIATFLLPAALMNDTPKKTKAECLGTVKITAASIRLNCAANAIQTDLRSYDAGRGAWLLRVYRVRTIRIENRIIFKRGR